MATQNTDSQVIDLEAIAQLRALQSPRRPRFLIDLVEKYASDARNGVASIRAAVAAGDARELKARAHRLKGSSRTVGAAQVAELCAQLELLGKAGTTDASSVTLAELANAVDRAVERLRQLAA